MEPTIETQIPLLPGEIIEEILSMLPVKSLLKFRCVSKSWHSLIGCNRFIRTHLQKSRDSPNFPHHRILLNSYPPHHNLKNCSLHSLLKESVTDSVAIDDPVYSPEDSIRVVGCCNGLFCLLIGRKNFVLWNPCTKVTKDLPFLEDKLRHGYITKYGFGLDEANGDYKVLGILSVFWYTGRYEASGKVYSLKSNSWKRIEGQDVDSDTFGEAGKYVSGMLHWARKSGWDSSSDIVCFDLKSDAYGLVRQPMNMESGYYPSLGELEGCLCMLCDYRQIRFDVWVLKQYGVRESWYKVVSVRYRCDPWDGPFSIFYMDRNEDILLSYASSFIVFNVKENTFRSPQMVNFDQFREAEVYVESLVSP